MSEKGSLLVTPCVPPFDSYLPSGTANCFPHPILGKASVGWDGGFSPPYNTRQHFCGKDLVPYPRKQKTKKARHYAPLPLPHVKHQHKTQIELLVHCVGVWYKNCLHVIPTESALPVFPGERRSPPDDTPWKPPSRSEVPCCVCVCVDCVKAPTPASLHVLGVLLMYHGLKPKTHGSFHHVLAETLTNPDNDNFTTSHAATAE